MATLTVSVTNNFSSTALNNITLIDFTNVGGAATATFAADQFNNVAIKDNVAIDGTAQANHIIVNLTAADLTLDASAWTFTNWTAGVPTSAVDAIIGDANFTGINQPTISATATCKSLTIGGQELWIDQICAAP